MAEVPDASPSKGVHPTQPPAKPKLRENEGTELGMGLKAIRWIFQQENQPLGARLEAVEESIPHTTVLFDDVVDRITKMEDEQRALKLQTTATVHVVSKMSIDLKQILESQTTQTLRECKQAANK